MVNLITPTARAALTRLYYLRLVTYGLLILSAGVLVAAVLLLPTYFAIHAEADEAARYVATLTESTTQRAKSQAGQTAAVFNESIQLLGSADQSPVVGPALEAILGPLPNTVSVDAVSLERGDGVTLTVTGIAATRASLIAYVDGLRAVPALGAVTVPVAALVSEVNSAYTITAVYTAP